MSRRASMRPRVECECGARVTALGMAQHLRGNDHAARLTQRACEAAGLVMLKGANGSTANALRLRGVPHQTARSWASGGRGRPGYLSTLVYVRPELVPSIACWSVAVATALLTAWERRQKI